MPDAVVQHFGKGDNRAASASRCVVFAASGAIAAFALWLVLPAVAGGSPGLMTMTGLLLLIAAGGDCARRTAGELRRLWHWGQPEVTASRAGLVFREHNRTIAWADITSVVPERRGAWGRVRIGLAGRPDADLVFATREPRALATAILADAALQRLVR